MACPLLWAAIITVVANIMIVITVIQETLAMWEKLLITLAKIYELTLNHCNMIIII